MNDRLISLNAALGALRTVFDTESYHVSDGVFIYYEDAVEAIDALPSEQSGWTPCNNAFPEEKLYVLVAYVPIYGLPDIGITYYSNGTWHAPSGSTPRKVIAWQKLPNPPKLDKKDGNGNE